MGEFFVKKKNFILPAVFLALFVIWTIVLCFVDVQPIGPRASTVGLAALNGYMHNLLGENMLLYTITDWLGLVPVAFCCGFAVLGLCQWVKRKDLQKVDADLLILGGFYVMVFAAYLLFEEFPVNHRPVLIEGILEVSYPSSTTLLVLCIMPTSLLQLFARIQNHTGKRILAYVIIMFTVWMVVGRLLSGVHWVSDIIGGALLSGGFVGFYKAFVSLVK